jgi:hypothetical protein
MMSHYANPFSDTFLVQVESSKAWPIYDIWLKCGIASLYWVACGGRCAAILLVANTATSVKLDSSIRQTANKQTNKQTKGLQLAFFGFTGSGRFGSTRGRGWVRGANFTPTWGALEKLLWFVLLIIILWIFFQSSNKLS